MRILKKLSCMTETGRFISSHLSRFQLVFIWTMITCLSSRIPLLRTVLNLNLIPSVFQVDTCRISQFLLAGALTCTMKVQFLRDEQFHRQAVDVAISSVFRLLLADIFVEKLERQNDEVNCRAAYLFSLCGWHVMQTLDGLIPLRIRLSTLVILFQT